MWYRFLCHFYKLRNDQRPCNLYSEIPQEPQGMHLLILHTYGDLHPRLKVLPQKYRLISARTPKNISRDCKVLTNAVRFSKTCLHLRVFDNFNPELSDNGIIIL